MKTISRIIIVIIIAYVNPSILLSQNLDSVNFVQSAKTSLIKFNKSNRYIKTSLKKDIELQTLEKELKQKGFSAVSNKSVKSTIGFETVYSGSYGKVNNLFYVKDYVSSKNEIAALCQIKITNGKRSEIYSFILISKDSKFQNVKEYHLDEHLQLQESINSWWNCWISKVVICCKVSCYRISFSDTFICIFEQCRVCFLYHAIHCKCYAFCCSCIWWCRIPRIILR